MLPKLNPHHILVKNKFEAEDILRLLKSGSSFNDLAQKFSICSSAKNGGNLGIVTARQLDSDFYEAYCLLKEGEISAPVRTRFGWHLIKKESVLTEK